MRRPSLGLTRVLFIRADHELITAVDRMLARERARRPGVRLSRSDLIREILHAGVVQQLQETEMSKNMKPPVAMPPKGKPKGKSKSKGKKGC